jgi:hypothetical protein
MCTQGTKNKTNKTERKQQQKKNTQGAGTCRRCFSVKRRAALLPLVTQSPTGKKERFSSCSVVLFVVYNNK